MFVILKRVHKILTLKLFYFNRNDGDGAIAFYKRETFMTLRVGFRTPLPTSSIMKAIEFSIQKIWGTFSNGYQKLVVMEYKTNPK